MRRSLMDARLSANAILPESRSTDAIAISVFFILDVDRVIDEVGGGTAVKSEPVSKTGSLGREVRMSVAGLVEGHTVEPIHHGIHVLFP